MRPSPSFYVERQVDALVRFAELSEGERILDVGCGMGRYTFPLAERGLRVEGSTSPGLFSIGSKPSMAAGMTFRSTVPT